MGHNISCVFLVGPAILLPSIMSTTNVLTRQHEDSFNNLRLDSVGKSDVFVMTKCLLQVHFQYRIENKT